MTFIPVDCGRNDVNDQAMGAKAEAALRPSKNYARGTEHFNLVSSPLFNITAFTTFFVFQSIQYTTVKMAKPFDPEEAENLEDVRPHRPY